ncbi:conjugative relaxase-like TrwC/TraI family protein [Novosphingobium chloroacetimidivorans]|uniref:Conjugative relaxase-like TrwC/TraI family protein n=1 Tax=Novosphingobium chloroacetimidivorans TaxID=1428314 RepID=A0A7W7KBL7_9SPHN|nr:MobF family relaxase [Novosphingobium chloroacetimidivorans]MBB4859183.1 conjugative relaxase-like TrwC/TraI family protein [Novosphingobium chloroacetimidivorans]
MHSIATVRSAAGAASYFAKDDYYTGEHAEGVSAWGGAGAKDLGLRGEVDKDAFENLLNSKLPDGTIVNATENRRAGLDLTFSAPKSVSILALVTGDKRILAAQEKAVLAAMKMIESKHAEARDYSQGRNGEPVRTGNLVYATFQHDTSRKLDPQLHTHAVVAAITKLGQGTWKALWNGEIWKNNTVIGSTYHAALRAELEKIGYRTEITGKHGQFEIKGVPKPIIDEFSQRRQDILAKAEQLGKGRGDTETLREITKRTRDDKLNVEDRAALGQSWRERATELGFDGSNLVAEAKARASGPDRYAEREAGTLSGMRELYAQLRDTLGEYLRPRDPLTTNGLARSLLSPADLRTEMAVASAVRILGQREAAFDPGRVAKQALDLGIKGVTFDRVDARIDKLLESGELIAGKSDRHDGVFTLVTTPDHIAQERKLLAGIDEGRRASSVIVPAAQATDRLQAVAGDRPLNGEQLGAAILALSSTDRTVVVQGVAGAGKTTLIETLAKVAHEEGRDVVGLALANKMVNMLKDEAGIPAQTVSSFVNDHLRGALRGEGPRFEASSEALRGKVLVLDEASLVANEQMNNLVTIANALEVDRLVLIGDRKQLQPIDAGKAFSLVQSHDPSMARLDTSQRQMTDHMKAVATLTGQGQFRAAFEVLGERVIQAGDQMLPIAAKMWLDLSAQDRERTAVYSSGRDARSELNKTIQSGLRDEGTIKGEGRALTTLTAVNTERELLRYPATYKRGQVIEVFARNGPSGLDRGRYEVKRVDDQGKVHLTDEQGNKLRLDPKKMDPSDDRDPFTLLEKDRVKLHEGDRIFWNATDKQRGLDNAASAKVLHVDADTVRVQTANGAIVDLASGDRMLERLGLAYAINMNQAQGMTTDKGIGTMNSNELHLSNQRLGHVMATRVREDITIVTNDSQALLRTIDRNPGNKMSALEAIGEKVIDPIRSPQAAGAPPIVARPTIDRETLRAQPKAPITPQLPVPEKGLDLSL